MTSTYNDYSQRQASQKIVLVWMHALERLVLWTLDSGAIYKRNVGNKFVVAMFDGTTQLTAGTSAALNPGEFYYDSQNGDVYIRMSDDSNPQTKDIAGVYRFFFSNSPEILPFDLASGAEVEYEARVNVSPKLKKELDDEQIGLALEGSSSITLLNADGYFDDLFDTLIWEFKNFVAYSWNPTIPLSEKKKIFEGIVQNKGHNDDAVNFSLKDDLLKLRQDVNLELFDTSDGTLSDSVLNTPKRRLYGQFQNAECIPIDNTLEGFALTGTISGDLASSTITGVGTNFLDETSPGDLLVIPLAVETLEISIETVVSDTEITVSEPIETSFAGVSASNRPERPYRRKNRRFHIAGHKLREPATTITEIVQNNRIRVADTTDFFADDLIDVNGEDQFIKRIVGDVLVLKQNLQSIPSVSDPVTKNPVSRVFIRETEAFINRDWTLINTSTDAILVFNDLAEFNIAKTRGILGTFDFQNGSKTVSVTGIDALNELRPRDWIRSKDVSHTTWYEILSVQESEVELRVAYAGANFNGDAQRKNVEYINDETLITVDCIGKELSGVWQKTASDAVRDLVENDAGLTNVDSTSFDTAKIEAPYVLSFAIPESPGGSVPKIRDAISTINDSVFGSLVNDNDFNVVYQILTPEKPEDLEVIQDDDIVSGPTTNSNNNIVRKITAQYRPFVDRFKSEDTFLEYEFTNDFVDKFVGATETLEKTLYLFDTNAAETIAERYALYNSLSQANVTVTTKLNLMLKNLNDKIYLNMDRLYKRFGNRDNRKIGILNSIQKDGADVRATFIDLGNVFNRVMSIAPDAANDFTGASDDEKIRNGYIVDNDLEIPDVTDDKNIFTQIIG